MQTVGGRYALDGRLGEGGMGHVYRARHLQLGKPFALKLIAPAFAEDTVARARFNQEAKLASEISHPNIVSVVDFGEDTQFGAYMVMELVEGTPLVGAGTLPMTMRRALDVLAQVADALDHAHADRVRQASERRGADASGSRQSRMHARRGVPMFGQDWNLVTGPACRPAPASRRMLPCRLPAR